MKKLLVTASLSLSVIFAYGSTIEAAEKSDKTKQQPGTSAGISEDEEVTVTEQERETTVTEEPISPSQQMELSRLEEELKSARTCTDEGGVTHARNEPGFDTCVQSKLDNARKQMGGEVEKQYEETEEYSESMSEGMTSDEMSGGSPSDSGTSDSGSGSGSGSGSSSGSSR